MQDADLVLEQVLRQDGLEGVRLEYAGQGIRPVLMRGPSPEHEVHDCGLALGPASAPRLHQGDQGQSIIDVPTGPRRRRVGKHPN